MEDVGSNVFYAEAMNLGERDAAFAQADRVVSAMIDSGEWSVRGDSRRGTARPATWCCVHAALRHS